MLIESGGLPSDSTSILVALTDELDINWHEPSILFISLQVGSPFKLDNCDVIIAFRVNSTTYERHVLRQLKSWLLPQAYLQNV